MHELATRPDSEIDFSDIPELDDAFFENAQQGMMYRLMKKQLTLRLDADILDWFKRHAKNGKGYQTDINKALRAYIVAQESALPNERVDPGRARRNMAPPLSTSLSARF